MPLTLEAFDGDATDGPMAESAHEALQGAAYDQGYAAGWEDATRAGIEGQTRIDADLARHLQQLGLTYAEARQHMLAALAPLMSRMVTGLLPEIAREALAPVVLAELFPLAKTASDAPVTLVLHPAARKAIETRLANVVGLPLTIAEDATLDRDQVFLRLDTVESCIEARIDLTAATARIAAAIRGFFDLTHPPPRVVPPSAAEHVHG